MDYNITLRYICVSCCVFVGFGGVVGLSGSGTEDSTALEGRDTGTEHGTRQGSKELNRSLDEERRNDTPH